MNLSGSDFPSHQGLSGVFTKEMTAQQGGRCCYFCLGGFDPYYGPRSICVSCSFLKTSFYYHPSNPALSLYVACMQKTDDLFLLCRGTSPKYDRGDCSLCHPEILDFELDTVTQWDFRMISYGQELGVVYKGKRMHTCIWISEWPK